MDHMLTPGKTDLDLFFKIYAPWVPNGTHPDPVSINDAKTIAQINSSEIIGESIVDFDLAFSLLYPQSITQYQSQPTVKQFNLTLKELGNEIVTGNVIAISPFLDALDGTFCTTADREGGAECGTIELTRVLSMSYG
jgi:tripeptidyl-peptidase I